ncbi:MAG: hypothetical protein MR742_06090 [Clostridiales bacterium]|nr:hypothetical protein [Clostridiales bacterium]
MQSAKGKAKKPVVEVKKPILRGSWHGKDAWKLAFKRMLSVLAVTVIYLIAGMLLSFESLWGRLLSCIGIVGLAVYYQYYQGTMRGENDAAFGEIMYVRQESGRPVGKDDRARCFHPFKGMFAALVGAAPFVVFTVIYAALARPITYTLGVLPSWTEALMRQSEFANALSYYESVGTLGVMDILRVVDRTLIMPFVNVFSYVSNDAALLAERLSPLFVLIAPLAYGLGYTQGTKMRDKINTGIKMGDDKKKRRERKERKQRQRSKAPERLI